MVKNATILILTGLFVYACATVPITGRRQLAMVSNQEILPLADKQYEQVLDTSKLSTNQQYVRMVKTVGSKIQKAVEQFMAEKGQSEELAGFEWEFNVIEAPNTANAWCMPGGKVAFYTGIMPICKDEAGVAVVMGHEVAHAIANHGRERMSQGLLANGLLGTVSGAMGQNPSLTQEVFMQAIGMGAQIGMLSFSRQHESEADRIGLIFMAIAGYDPHEAPKFWERMTQAGGGAEPPQWLSTHPSHATRINDLNKAMPEAMKYYEGNR